MTKNIKTQILHKSYEKKNTETKTKNERDYMRGNEDMVQIYLLRIALDLRLIYRFSQG